MKKSLLSLALSVGALTAFSQVVVFDVLTPEEVAGNYFVEYTPAGADGWPLVPDLINPANSVTGELVFAVDGTAADSIACEPLANPAEVDGKIAMMYRGVCPFALKAKHAHEAGAIAVVIINNLPGAAPIVPGAAAGGDGVLVDIPVAMVSYETGQLVTEYVNSGTATAFLGAATFANDLSHLPSMVLRPKAATIPITIAQNANEFSTPLGSFLVNNGTETQTGVSLQATVSYNGTELYNASEGGFTIESGDSLFIALPTFSQPAYSLGRYEIIYTADSDQDEEFVLDNAPIDASVTLTEDLFSYSPYDMDSESVPAVRFERQGTFNEVFKHCIHFRDPNASRLRLEGMELVANVDAGSSIDGLFVDIIAYTWEDQFETIDDATIEQVIDFDYGVYDFSAGQEGDVVYQPFDQQVVLEDNVRYLFCVSTISQVMRYGYGPIETNYVTTASESGQPTFPIFTVNNDAVIGTSFFFPGFGQEFAPAFAAKLVDITVTTKDQEKVEIIPYPNPTMDYIAIPYNGTAATANMLIYDNAGKLVKSTNVNFAGNNMIQVDMAGVPNGNYVFNMQFNDGTTSTFKVVVAR